MDVSTFPYRGGRDSSGMMVPMAVRQGLFTPILTFSHQGGRDLWMLADGAGEDFGGDLAADEAAD